MHDRIDRMLRENTLEQRRIAGVSNNEFTMRYGRFESGGEVIERDDILAGIAELFDDMATDVSGATGDQYLVVIHQ
jgi:urease gamma subunit